MESTVLIIVILFSQIFIGQTMDLRETNTNRSNDQCLKEYSWEAKRNGRMRTYHYVIETRQCLDCPPRMLNVDVENPAEKVTFMNYSFYRSRNEMGESVTCLNITFEINRSSASNTKGLMFKLENWDVKHCFTLNFTTALDDTSILDRRTESLNRRFYFDCFCDLKQSDGPEYLLTIQPVPFRIRNCTVTDDQKLEREIILPNCDNPGRTRTDKYCPEKKEEWRPVGPISFTQVFPEFNRLRVTFDIAPPHYHITTYQVYIRPLNSFVPYQIGQGNFRIFQKDIGGSRLNFTSVDYDVKPNELREGDDVLVLVMPCTDDKCHTAIQGPVITFRGSPCSRPDACGPLASCIPTAIDDFRCQCVDGATNSTNQTCIMQSPDGVPVVNPGYTPGYTPGYAPGYTPGYIPGYTSTATKTSLVVLFVVIAITAFILFWRAFKRKASVCPSKLCSRYGLCSHVLSARENVKFEIASPDPEPEPVSPSGIEILLAYPEDSDEFVQIVEKLAIFLTVHGRMKCILSSQQTLQIGKKGPEQWAAETSARVNKVLWVCSKSAERALQETQAIRGPGPGSQVRAAYGNMFRKLATVTQDERETESTRSKHVVCYFSKVSLLREVPRIFCNLLRFDLMQDMESMCFYLLGREKANFMYRDNLPYLSGQRATPERTALVSALENRAGSERLSSPEHEIVPSQTNPLLSSASLDSSYSGSRKSVQFVEVDETDRKDMSIVWKFLKGESSVDDVSDDDNDDDDKAHDDHRIGSGFYQEDGGFVEEDSETVCNKFGKRIFERPLNSGHLKYENTSTSSATDTGYSSVLTNPNTFQVDLE